MSKNKELQRLAAVLPARLMVSEVPFVKGKTRLAVTNTKAVVR
jgi:hypothetical protein